MLLHAVLIHYSSYPKHPSESNYSSNLKIWKWLQVEVIACGISWNEFECSQGWSTKKLRNLGVPFFDLGIFKECYHKFMESQLFQNFQDKSRNFSGLFTKDFSQPPCLFFFLEQTTDWQIDILFWVLTYPAHCTGLELLPEPPQNKICYRLHPKYTSFSCFPIVWSSAVWKSLF